MSFKNTKKPGKSLSLIIKKKQKNYNRLRRNGIDPYIFKTPTTNQINLTDKSGELPTIKILGPKKVPKESVTTNTTPHYKLNVFRRTLKKIKVPIYRTILKKRCTFRRFKRKTHKNFRKKFPKKVKLIEVEGGYRVELRNQY